MKVTKDFLSKSEHSQRIFDIFSNFQIATADLASMVLQEILALNL